MICMTLCCRMSECFSIPNTGKLSKPHTGARRVCLSRLRLAELSTLHPVPPEHTTLLPKHADIAVQVWDCRCDYFHAI